ncbi:MAG: MFS transporter [Candidatus Bathyarchaeota archaeon]|nr:MFS transporter [Candidatus Bathyarchaeota archaeon]
MLSEIRQIMKGNILVLTVCSSLWRVSVDIVWAYIGLYVMELGGVYSTVGLVTALGNFASMLLYPLGGYIADYHGRIKIMAYMTYAYSFTFLIYVFTNSWQWVAIGMFMQSLVTFYLPAMQALMADSIPENMRGVGFSATMAIPSAFGIASPYIGGWLIDKYGMIPAVKSLYAVGFFVALIVATLRYKYLTEVRPVEGEGIKITAKGIPSLLVTAYKDIIKTVKEAPRHLMTFSVLVAASTFFVSLVTSFWIIRATEIIGLTKSQWGSLSLITGTIYVVLSFPAGKLVDKYSKKWVLGLCMIATSIPCYLYLHATTYVHVVILMILTTIPNTFINPALQSIFIDMTPPDKRGRMIAAIGGANIWITGGAWATGVLAMMSITVGSLLSGYIYSYSTSLPWIILAVSMTVIGVLIILLVKDIKYEA